jgi:hypothetical protein
MKSAHKPLICGQTIPCFKQKDVTSLITLLKKINQGGQIQLNRGILANRFRARVTINDPFSETVACPT